MAVVKKISTNQLTNQEIDEIVVKTWAGSHFTHRIFIGHLGKLLRKSIDISGSELTHSLNRLLDGGHINMRFCDEAGGKVNVMIWLKIYN